MAWITNLWKRKQDPAAQQDSTAALPVVSPVMPAATFEMDIPEDDPFLAYILTSPGVVQVEKLKLESPTLLRLREAGIKLAVPLISQGELIALLNLGPRLSEADYTTDDFRLLSTLATQAAPALRVAQLARQQQIEARQRERIDQEMRVARVVQQTLLPHEVPSMEGWHIDAYWQPARAVSGDFYDFIKFSDGRMGFIVADVTDKGVPAALVMATSRSVMRAVAEQVVSPGAVLEQANELLCPNMPAKMFVTCLYAVLDPKTGLLRYANAGHNPPFQQTSSEILELRARGMPLGLMPGMHYEEKETFLEPGDNVIMYSDGLVEAHNAQGEMFGYPRMRQLMSQPRCGEELIQCMMSELRGFTGPDWEQEDDVTFVSLNRLPFPDQLLAEYIVPSRAGEEKGLMKQVKEAVAPLALEANQVDRLGLAVAEATMNAMEHGNHFQEDKPVKVRLFATPVRVLVQVEDHGGDTPIHSAETPDLQAKLEGLQSPRGWGLYLINNLVDEVNSYSQGEHHIVELVLKR